MTRHLSAVPDGGDIAGRNPTTNVTPADELLVDVETPPATYGRLVYDPPSNGRARGRWIIAAVPHVSLKIKRWFPRIWPAAPGTSGMQVFDTPDIARDLQMILARYPLQIDNRSRAHLDARADEHRHLERTRVEITAGRRTLDLREPARPARPYQLQAADLALTTRQLLLADDVGLGKTFSALLMARDPATLPMLVVTLTHLPAQWLRELEKSMPWLTGHVITGTSPYDVTADVIVTSYSKLQGWGEHLAGQVNTVVFDECQELRRDGTIRYTNAQRVAAAAEWRLGLSATPVYNYGGEIHTIMSVIAPDALGTRPEFVREWDGAQMSNDRVRVGDPGALGTFLRDEGLLLRRTRADVAREIPDPIRITHDVDADADALEQVKGDARALAELITSGTGKDKFLAGGELDWMLRQATGIAKAPYVAEFVNLLLESEAKVVLFGWHRAVYDIWLSKLAKHQPALYTGSETPRQKQAAVDRFVDPDSDCRVLILSLRSGAGLDGLQHAASVCVFGELDWSPAMHDQCIGRVARDGQEAAVAAYFLVAQDGSDPPIADALELKTQQAEPIRNPDAPLVEPVVSDPDRISRLVDAVLNPTGGTP